MQQPTIDDKDLVPQSGNAGEQDSSVYERLEGVEDQLKLLKSEVKQTLIDLREFVMKGSATLVTSVFEAPSASPSNGQVVAPENQYTSPPLDQPIPPEATGIIAEDEQIIAASREPAPVSDTSPVEIAELAPDTVFQTPNRYPQGNDPMDVVRMGHMIGWLGTVAEGGLSPKQLKPFLQAYERSGHLTPTLAMFAYRLLEEMESDRSRFSLTRSPAEISKCLQELHEIIINPGYAPSPEPPVDSGRDG